MDLIGLVVAGQRIHHEIDAAAQRQLPLPRAAGNQRIERLGPSSSLGPGRGEIIRDDDDRRHAVACARRRLARSFGSVGGKRLDPGLAVRRCARRSRSSR